jgi:hypothetical protein
VRPRRAGHEVRYALLPERLAEAAAWMNALAERCDDRLARIAAIAEGRDEA